MSHKALSLLLGAAVALFGLCQTSEAASPKMTLKLSHPNPENHSFHKAAVIFKKEVEEKSNGNITITIFPNHQLGGSTEIVNSLSLGAIELNISGSAQYSHFNSDLEALDLPFLFPSRAAAYAKLDGEAGKFLAKPLEKKNIYVLGYLDGGFRSMFNSKRSLVHPADFAGLPVRVQDSSVYMDMMATMGALPSFIPWGDLYVSIQQGIVDAGESGVAQIHAQRFFEVAKYVSLTNHTFTSNPFAINLNKWKSLPEDYKTIIAQAAKNMIDYERKAIVEDEIDSMEQLKKAGVVINEVDAAEFQAAVAPVWDRFAQKKGRQLVDLLTK